MQKDKLSENSHKMSPMFFLIAKFYLLMLYKAFTIEYEATKEKETLKSHLLNPKQVATTKLIMIPHATNVECQFTRPLVSRTQSRAESSGSLASGSLPGERLGK